MKLASFPLLALAVVLLAPLAAQADDGPLDWDVGMSVNGYHDAAFVEIGPLRAAGFECIQLSLPYRSKTVKTDDQRIAWLKKFAAACKKIDLEIAYVHVPFSRSEDISQLDDAKRQTWILEVVKLMNWNKIIGAGYFVIHPSAEPIPNTERPQRIKNCAISLKLLNAEAKKRGIRLVVENLPRTCLGNTSAEMNAIVEQAGPDMCICFDTNHLLKEKPEEFLANFTGTVAAIHVSDYDYIDERHWIPYQGKCDWQAIAAQLVKRKYRGPFMFESRKLNDNTVADWPVIMRTWTRLKKEYTK